VLHFHKLGQQRKVSNENEGSRPTKYSKSRESTMNFGVPHKQIHSVDSNGCRPPKNWEKNFSSQKFFSHFFGGLHTSHWHQKGIISNKVRGSTKLRKHKSKCFRRNEAPKSLGAQQNDGREN
jgi:hypothetical protein